MSGQTPEKRFRPYRHCIPDYDLFCRKLRQPLPRHLRVNTLKASVAETRSRLLRRGLTVVHEEPFDMVLRLPEAVRPGTLPEFSLGHIHSQALSSVLAALALAPEPGELILDLCAAPGSKTTMLAQVMGNKGIIVANDKNLSRLIPLRANLKRLGVLNTVTTRYPGQHFPKRVLFDRLLVDVPCSAEGTLRAVVNGTLPAPAAPGKSLPALQAELLLRAFDLLRPGGILVYATCTYNPVENEGVIQSLLENRPATIQPIELEVPHAAGLPGWEEAAYDPSICHCWRIYPHQLDTVGFFLARVAKTE